MRRLRFRAQQKEEDVSTGDGAIILMPGVGRTLGLPDRGATVTLKVTGDDSGSRLAIVESAPAPGAPGLAMHRHHRSDEALYVLDGTVTVRVGDQAVEAPPGAFVFIPRGTAHMFRNPGPEPARVLVIFVPAGVERFLLETAGVYAAPGKQPDPATLHEIQMKHDTELVRDHPRRAPGS